MNYENMFYVLGFRNFDKKLISFLSNYFIAYFPIGR